MSSQTLGREQGDISKQHRSGCARGTDTRKFEEGQARRQTGSGRATYLGAVHCGTGHALLKNSKVGAILAQERPCNAWQEPDVAGGCSGRRTA